MSGVTLVANAPWRKREGAEAARRVAASASRGYDTPTEGIALKPPAGEVTELLRQAASGSEQAKDRLFELILPELCRIASARLRRERSGHSLGTTDLVLEAYLRLSRQQTFPAENRAQFLATFAMAMRRVLIDHAKKKISRRHGGDWQRVSLHPNLSLPGEQVESILAIHGCLERLEKENPRQGRIVELRFFGGLSNPEIAAVLDISLSTVEADWRFARAWLRVELEGAPSGDRSSAKGTRAEAL